MYQFGHMVGRGVPAEPRLTGPVRPTFEVKFDRANDAVETSAVALGTRLTLATKGNWTLDANYDFEYKEDFTSHTGWADIRYRF